jgi:hypothetical protein
MSQNSVGFGNFVKDAVEARRMTDSRAIGPHAAA